MTGPETFRGLVGDIGGTNARFAIAERAGGTATLSGVKVFETDDYPDLYAVIDAYFEQAGGQTDLDFAVLAVAGPVVDGEIHFTNLDWVVSEVELAKRTGARTTRLINDLAAIAYALPHLTDADCHLLGTVREGESKTLSVMGAGTGFGAAVLVEGRTCLSTESGHASWAPVNDFERDIHKFLSKKYGRVTIEMVLSGPGLVHLYEAITFVRGEPTLDLTPAQITNLDGPDAQGSRYTVETFFDILGSVCGDLALLHGATGGMYIAGGITPKLIKYLDEGRFRARMEAKAPMATLVESIPSRVITHPYPALVGAANALTEREIRA
ncbi:glucokinase [Asticcacaulis sp. BYS171W]|uniref:Glucokinase n=1 Tax=Asticcacaulis aquaticus TaxID=2984212 RepID=A0ABT5HW36_9CAUL|nr:glucokinase [Asticcacaulis aquaticus]MDC7683646.1 glucokinase [Asticcacaulis aquaticus]